MAETEANKNPKYGITGVMNFSFPTEREIELSHNLEQYCRDKGLFESQEGEIQRQILLGKLNLIIRDWIRKVGKKKGYVDDEETDNADVIYTYGSYRLGVHGKGSDLDVLCVGPVYVDRNEFFESLPPILEASKDCTSLKKIPESFTPILKITFGGFDLDLLYAMLGITKIPPVLDLEDESLLKNLDEKSKRCLCGRRDTDKILELVPNVEVFRLTLRAVKLWAKNRGIYGNVYGYPGGIAWGILVARTCQLFPNAASYVILVKLFAVFKIWKYHLPIHLVKTDLEANKIKGIMQVITPAEPCMNSTHNVTKSTLELIKSELERGSDVMNEVFKGNATLDTLFSKRNFFAEYKYFVWVHSYHPDEAECAKWYGYIESKIRFLVLGLEIIQTVKYAHPRSHPYEMSCSMHDKCQAFIIGLEIEKEQKEQIPSESADGISKDTKVLVVDIGTAFESFITRVNENFLRTLDHYYVVDFGKRSKLKSFLKTPSTTPIKNPSPMSEDQNTGKRIRTSPTTSQQYISSYLNYQMQNPYLSRAMMNPYAKR